MHFLKICLICTFLLVLKKTAENQKKQKKFCALHWRHISLHQEYQYQMKCINTPCLTSSCVLYIIGHSLEWWGAGMVICLERGADLHMAQLMPLPLTVSVWSEVQTCIWPSWCHCHSLSLASAKSRLVLPFWYRLTWVVLEKGPLNVCVCVCVCL